MRADAALRAILSDEKALFSLPRELVTTDRILQRWAVSIGLGLPTEAWDDQRKCLPPPLSDDIAIIVDQCILHSPPKTKELVTRWYKTPNPVEAIARRLKMTPRNVYRMHGVALEFLRWRLEGTKNRQLVLMIRAIPD